MKFLLCVDKEANLKDDLEISGFDSTRQNAKNRSGIVLFTDKKPDYTYLDTGEQRVVIIGDLIIPPAAEKRAYIHSLLKGFGPDRLREIRGHFYLILQDIMNGRIQVFNSLFSILPVYYAQGENRILISSNAGLINKWRGGPYRINKRFLLELLMFNYQFFNQSIYAGIFLLPSNSYAGISNQGISVVKHTYIEEYFTTDPHKVTDSLDKLSSLFISSAKQYFPREKMLISFTGGFDGRTLVSCVSQHHEFETYSFGTKINPDILIPESNASSLGIKHCGIMLDDEKYLDSGFKESGEALIHLTDGSCGYIYSHFVYAAKFLSQKANYLLNGFFGSELFRAIHISGAVTSPVLIKYFLSEDHRSDLIRDEINSRLKYLNINTFKEEADHLIEDLGIYKKNLGGTLNQQFYVFVFEEIFRKFFGPLIFAQMQYFKVRSPYLDFDFIRELQSSKLAGANNSFFTHNPLKRFKGQMLYADIIRKTSGEIFYQKTGKGYRPADILIKRRIPNILIPYVVKRIQRTIVSGNSDPFAITACLKRMKQDGIRTNLRLLEPMVKVEDLLKDYSKMDLKTEESMRDNIAHILSLSAYLKMIRYEENLLTDGL